MRYFGAFLAGAVLAVMLNVGKPVVQKYCAPYLAKQGVWM